MLSPIDESEYGDESDKLLEANYFTEVQRSIVINESQPLARCSVLYLGTAIPSADQRGIDSIQEPLLKRYSIDGKEVVQGIEAWLSIDENGLQIQFASDPFTILYYPIRSLVYCASIRFATHTQTGDKFANDGRFVPLDSPEASVVENTQNPPLFAIIFHRTRHLPMDECHCFVAKSKQVALQLVQACSDAYTTTDSKQDCSKVPLYFKTNDNGSEIEEIDDEILIVPALDEEKTLDYQINKEASGFFYKTGQVPIDYWQLGEHQKQPSNNHSLGSSRRLASITSIPEIESQSINESIEEPSSLTIDPYAPEPNVIRVERIKDIQSGRDIYIRWLHDPSEVPEQVTRMQTPNYDFYVDFNTDYQSEKELPNEIQRLTLDDNGLKKSVTFDDRIQLTPTYYEHKKSKKKSKHRYDEFIEDRHRKKRSVKSHRHKHHEVVHMSTPPLLQQEFLLPPPLDVATFHTIQLPSEPNSTPFWFFSM